MRHMRLVRAGGLGLLLVLLVVPAVFPQPAWAACGPLDMGACIDNAEYSLYYLIASIAWNVNRWLLLLAYQFDQLRAWLVEVAFTSAYQWLTSFIQPVYIPIAAAALMLAAILFMLVPLTGETGFINMRHVVIWAVLTPVVLTAAGQLIAQAEQVRSDISSRLFTQMSSATPGAIFGSPGSDMPTPTALYPANPCGATLARRTTTGIAMDALAAALMYADAGDVHCPDARGPSRDIPDGFYNEPPSYAYDGYVGDLDSAVERRGWVEGMQRGMNRLLQGIIPSFLAVLESLIHLVFSLSMVVLWLSLPIGLIFVWFQQTASPVSAVLRRAASILVVSWTASLVMGVLSAALVAAAALGNAGAYTGMTFGGLFLMGYLCLVALSALWKSISTVEQTALNLAGLSLTQPLQTAAQLTTTAVTGVASGVMTGGAAYVGMAAMGSAAFAQAKDAGLRERMTYTTSAMAGRLPGVGAVGEVAAAMGWLDTDSAVYEGLYAGERSRHGWRSARLQLERDNAAPRSAPPPAAPPGVGASTPGGPQSSRPASGGPGVAASPGVGAGLVGPVGSAGPQGRSGPGGMPGSTGGPGPQGQPGPAGSTGAAGPPAQPGQAQGTVQAATPAGTPNALSASGYPVPISAASVSGAPGPASTGGQAGQPGPAGATGTPGQTGVAGITGQPGPTGQTGATGQPGPAGLAAAPDPAGGLSPAGPSLSAGPAGAAPAVGQPIPPALVGTPGQPSLPGRPDAAGSPAPPSTPGFAGQPGGAGPASVPAVAVQPPTASTSSSPGIAASPVQHLPANHPHVAHAASRIPPLPNRLHNGVDWAYAGSISLDAGYRHIFRHPHHPLTGRPELRTVETTDAEVPPPPRHEPAGGAA